MTSLAKLKYRLTIRRELQKADDTLLKITKEELYKEYVRRNKERTKK